MKLPFLASVLVFCVWLAYEIHKHNSLDKKAVQGFWERESTANDVRRKSLESLSYVKFSLENFPIQTMKDDENIVSCISIMEKLQTEKIVNLTGISNTDLKLTYGTANITELSCYDDNYTLFSKTLYEWASILFDHEYFAEAKTLLEFGISTKTDIKGNYELLCKIYAKENKFDKINDLKEVASTLNTLSKQGILRMLEEYSL